MRYSAMCRVRNGFRRWMGLAAIALMVQLCSCGVALAHKVHVFPYVEGRTVTTTSYFSDGTPCRDATIIVYGPDEEEVLRGKTDEKGEFSFEAPFRADLRIVLDAISHDPHGFAPVLFFANQ